jgi:carboxypeptidase T
MRTIHFRTWLSLAFALTILAFSSLLNSAEASSPRFIQVAAKNKYERSAIARLGMSIEAVRSDSVWGFANDVEIAKLQRKGFHILGNFPIEVARGGHVGTYDFPAKDSIYHNYARLVKDVQAIQSANSDIMRVVTIGKSLEGRDVFAIHINTNPNELNSRVLSPKPGVIFMGAHHAREHLSVEVPFLLAKYLMDKRRSPLVSPLLDKRDIWLIPMINPDGAEFDISTGRYAYWRKNRRDNKDGTYGVDLNRNYGYEWGTGGSDPETDSETYMGPQPFSEPETQAVRDFVRAQKNTKILLTFHTFSELILYPWGHTHDPIANTKDLAVFKTMAKTMAQWNHYTPQASSDLYIASGDTTDWAYGELGIFAFTFEMSPGSMSGANGFYPGPKMIDRAFNDNLKPCLYLLQVAGDPYSVINGTPSQRFLTHYGEPKFLDFSNLY